MEENEKTDEKKKPVAFPSLGSLQKPSERSRKRSKYKDNPVMDFVGQTKDAAVADFLIDKITYHKSCYANIANIAKLEFAEKTV